MLHRECHCVFELTRHLVISQKLQPVQVFENVQFHEQDVDKMMTAIIAELQHTLYCEAVTVSKLSQDRFKALMT